MVRNSVRGKNSYFKSSAKVGAARQALARASVLLGRRSAPAMGSSCAPSASRGFYGGYRQFARRGIPELKFTDTAINANAVGTSWTVQIINGITQGMDYNQRVGRQVTLKSFLLNWSTYNSSTTSLSADEGVFGRIVLIYDSQPNSGSTPVGTDIFAAQDPLSPMNLNNRDRFKVLLDKRFQIGPFSINSAGTIASGAPQNTFGSKYKKLNLDMVFSGTGSTIGSISTGAMYLCWVADLSGLANLNFYSRVRYTDN